MGLDGTLYDQVLDFIFYLGLAPARFSVRSLPHASMQVDPFTAPVPWRGRWLASIAGTVFSVGLLMLARARACSAIGALVVLQAHANVAHTSFFLWC